MANAKILKKYLVDGEDSYLISSNNNGRVIMLSGKWGSGKTYFWQQEIQKILNVKDKKIPNHYISLYGKTSIQEIKNEIFLKVFESVDSFDSEEMTKKVVKSSIDLVSSLTKSISVFGMSLDLSKITDKSFEKIDSILNDEKLKRTENYLNSGAIICFDDFERKSKDIDLNDLFGFITQLTLNFSCKVVIILNDDVFEGVEKDVFSRVKEKSVFKFLKYEPSIKDLFYSIFDNDEKYRVLNEYKNIILNTIEETKELNARIYIQVLDNLVEWIKNEHEIDNDILRCLILVNINFILNHNILKRGGKIETDDNVFFTYPLKELEEEFGFGYQEEYYDNYQKYEIDFMIKLDEYKKDFYKNNKNLFKSHWFANRYGISENVDNKTFQKINNFIETGIL